MPTRYWALISGIVFVVVGLLAFIPSLTPLPYGPPPIAVGTGYGFLSASSRSTCSTIWST